MVVKYIKKQTDKNEVKAKKPKAITKAEKPAKKIVAKKTKAKGKKKPKNMVNGAPLPTKTSAKVVKDKDGVPQAAPPPRHKTLLGKMPIPDTEGKPHLERELSQGQVEILLLKGITSITQIAATIGVEHKTAKKYIEQAKYRWALLGGMPRMRQMRGESMARLELITSELWALFSNSKDMRVQGSCLSQLLLAHDRMNILNGLTEKTLPMIANEEELVDGRLSIGQRMERHKEAKRLAVALAKYVEENEIHEPLEGELVDVTEKKLAKA